MTVPRSQMAHWRYAFYVFLYKVCFVKLKTNNHANPPKVTQTGSSRRSEKAEIKLIWMGVAVRRRWYGIRCACLPDKTPADKWTLVSFPLALPPPPHLDDTRCLLEDKGRVSKTFNRRRTREKEVKNGPKTVFSRSKIRWQWFFSDLSGKGGICPIRKFFWDKSNLAKGGSGSW